MKRSKMVSKLNTWMDNNLGDFYSEDEIEKLLTYLERIGMIPPNKEWEEE